MLQQRTCYCSKSRAPGPQDRQFRRDHAAKRFAFLPSIVPVTDKIHFKILRLLWMLADMQTFKYFKHIWDEHQEITYVTLCRLKFHDMYKHI